MNFKINIEGFELNVCKSVEDNLTSQFKYISFLNSNTFPLLAIVVGSDLSYVKGMAGQMERTAALRL